MEEAFISTRKSVKSLIQEIGTLYNSISDMEDLSLFLTEHKPIAGLFISIAHQLQDYFPQAELHLDVDVSEEDPYWYAASIKVGIPPGQDYMEMYALMNKFYDEWWYKINVGGLIHVGLE